ncbi:hypothetical protein ScPMuIL_014578 [Solemya velum]
MELGESFLSRDSREDLRSQESPVREKKHSTGFDSDELDLCSPTGPKRRRIMMHDFDTPSSVSSQVSSQVSSRSDSPTLYEFLDDSTQSSPSISPCQTLKDKYKKRYKKDELWSAIKKNYNYIMDSDIINTCKTTESDLSLDDEDSDTNTSFSYTEFTQQFHELSDWLCKLQQATSCKTLGLTISEKYVYQSWHEEMLKKSPRLKLLNEYASQVEERYPKLKSEINVRLEYLNTQWKDVQKGLNSRFVSQDPETMFRALEDDLGCLRKWLDNVELKLSSLRINPLWSVEELESKLLAHKELQKDIESHSRVGHLQFPRSTIPPADTALALQKRWHSVWLCSLEWQCRLEDVIIKKKGNHETSPFCDDEFLAKEDSFLDLSGYSVDDSFRFDTGFRGDVVFSPLLSDSSANYSTCLEKPSGKDSACASEGELKLSDMSEQVDLSLSTGSDSDFDMHRRMKVRLDSKDIGYGSESHSNDEAEYKKFHQSFSLVAGKRDGKYDIYRMTVVESTDRTDGDEAEVGLPDTCSSKDSTNEKSESDAVANKQNIPSELDYDSSPKEDIKFLIDQVDNVYRESSPFRSLDEKRRKEMKGENVSPGTDSVGPVMVDASVGTTTVVESSCDASGEDTSDSDSAEEFSTATDDGADTLFDSVICLDYTSDSKNASQENICSSSRYPPFFDTSRLRKNKRHGRTKERPWSVVELQDMNNKFDLKVFSTSESAIDRLTVNLSDSETPPKPFSKQQSSTFPRQRTKHHSFQRTFSASEQSSSSPVRSKRKLRYTHSSHTDTASGSHQTVPSTSSDDDTNVPGSETENLLARLQKAKMKTSSSSYDTDSGSSQYWTPMEIMPSDPEDVMNSGASFSETAWDNYQAPLYPTVSEDPSEEPLEWEPVDELEFDDEITIGRKSILADVISRRKSPEKKNKPTSYPKDLYDDSDSDKEDLCCVIEESAMSLKVADRSLRKKRKDPLGTGLNLNPAKYGEILATCDTNIECLKKIQHHLNASNVTDDELQQLSELLYEWEKIQALATERQAQSQDLKDMYATLLAVLAVVKGTKPELLVSVFDSPSELVSTVKALQAQCSELDGAQMNLRTLKEQVVTFTSENSTISMYSFHQQLQQTEVDVVKEYGGHLAGLELSQNYYCEYLSTKQELDDILMEERDLLQRLAFSREVNVSGTDEELQKDVKRLVRNLSRYEDKLTRLQTIHSHLSSVFSGPTQIEMKAGLADIRNQLLVVKRLCQELVKSGVMVSDEESMAIQNLGSQIEDSSKLDETPEHKKLGVRTWLHSKPVQTTAMFVLVGLLYWADPDIVNKITDFSIRITPEFSYVDGPPPV